MSIKQFDRAEVLKLLRNGHKEAILDYDLRYADFSNTNLSNIDLSDTRLRGINLSDADFSDADLRGANLRGANLSGADLSGANLSGANLAHADLVGADLNNADLSGAFLMGADLDGANLNGANLNGANLDYSCYPLSYGSLHFKADKRLACQLAYHLCSIQCDDADYIKMSNSILDFANQFHRVRECGELEEREI